MTAIGIHQATGKPITLSTDDRRRHLYVIGASDVGKSTLLESMALEEHLRRAWERTNVRPTRYQLLVLWRIQTGSRWPFFCP